MGLLRQQNSPMGRAFVAHQTDPFTAAAGSAAGSFAAGIADKIFGSSQARAQEKIAREGRRADRAEGTENRQLTRDQMIAELLSDFFAQQLEAQRDQQRLDLNRGFVQDMFGRMSGSQDRADFIRASAGGQNPLQSPLAGGAPAGPNMQQAGAPAAGGVAPEQLAQLSPQSFEQFRAIREQGRQQRGGASAAIPTSVPQPRNPLEGINELAPNTGARLTSPIPLDTGIDDRIDFLDVFDLQELVKGGADPETIREAARRKKRR